MDKMSAAIPTTHPKASRRPKFSEDELVALARAIKDRDHIISGKFQGAKASKTNKNKAWAEVVDAVNAVGGMGRTQEEIKTKHKNLRTSTKKVETENKREIFKTGGGKSKLKSLTESQLIILETLPSTLLDGIHGGIDLHDPSFKLPKVPTPTKQDEDDMDLLDLDEIGPQVRQPFVPGRSELQLAAQTVANASEAASLGEPVAHCSKTLPQLETSRTICETPKRKHRKLEVSSTEQLLREQVGLMRKQVEVMSDIKELMAERNRIEQEKLDIKKRKFSSNSPMFMSTD